MKDYKPKLALLKDKHSESTFYDVLEGDPKTGEWYFYECGHPISHAGVVVVKFCDFEEAAKHLEDEEYDGRFKWDVVGI